MEKKDAIYTVILAASLFSLSLLLISQGITNLSVSIRDEKPFAVSVPPLFSMNHILIMLLLTAIGSHCFTMLGRDLFIVKEHMNSENNAENSFPSLHEKQLSQTPNTGLSADSASSNEFPQIPQETRLPAFGQKSPFIGIQPSISPSSSIAGHYSTSKLEKSTGLSEMAENETIEYEMADCEYKTSVCRNPHNKEFNRVEHKKKVALEILQGDEKTLFVIISEKEEILQSDLVLESGFSKVKVSRVLQKLERKFLVKRKPYGNTNKVILAK